MSAVSSSVQEEERLQIIGSLTVILDQRSLWWLKKEEINTFIQH